MGNKGQTTYSSELPIDQSAPLAKTIDLLRASGVDISEAMAKELNSAAVVIIEDFELEPSYFEDGARALTFTVLANRLVEIKKMYKRHDSFGRIAHEIEHLNNLLLLLVSGASKVASTHLWGMPPQSMGVMAAFVYDEFTDLALSADFSELAKSELFETARLKLGRYKESELAFDTRVLKVATDFSFEGSQIDSDRRNELRGNAKVFASKVGMGNDLDAQAWVTLVDRKVTMCFCAPTAERLLAAHRKGNQFRTKDLALVEHEYFHTQSQSLRGLAYSALGVGIEERLAEWLSGDHFGYGDIKDHFMLIRLATGIDLVGIAQQFGVGNPHSTEKLLLEVVKQSGLDGCLNLLSAIPENYLNAMSEIQEVNQHVGGLDGLQQAMLDKKIADGEADGVVDDLWLWGVMLSPASQQQLSLLENPPAIVRTIQKLVNPRSAELGHPSADVLRAQQKISTTI